MAEKELITEVPIGLIFRKVNKKKELTKYEGFKWEVSQPEESSLEKTKLKY